MINSNFFFTSIAPTDDESFPLSHYRIIVRRRCLPLPRTLSDNKSIKFDRTEFDNELSNGVENTKTTSKERTNKHEFATRPQRRCLESNGKVTAENGQKQKRTNETSVYRHAVEMNVWDRSLRLV